MQDLHIHTCYDDGHDPVIDMARQALKNGFDSVGICVHSPIPGEDWCATEEGMQDFIRDARAAARDLEGQIPVYCGIELDSLSIVDRTPFDYVIGSVHVKKTPNGTWYYDDTREGLLKMVDVEFGGDRDQAMEDYFSRVAALAEDPDVDVVGHFDLPTKFNERPDPLFDESSKRYLDAAVAAMERLVNAEKIFEINTGAVSRGYRTGYYPSPRLLSALKDMDGRICISSDSHDVKTLGFEREKARALALQTGFSSVWEYNGETFTEVRL